MVKPNPSSEISNKKLSTVKRVKKSKNQITSQPNKEDVLAKKSQLKKIKTKKGKLFSKKTSQNEEPISNSRKSYQKKRLLKIKGNDKNQRLKPTAGKGDSTGCKSLTAKASSNWQILCQKLHLGKSKAMESPPGQKRKNSTLMKEGKNVSPKFLKGLNAKPSRVQLKESSNTPSTSDIWFDGVDPGLLERTPRQNVAGFTSTKENVLVKSGGFKGLTKAVAMDCEMVGIGEDGTDSMLARVSIVNSMGHCAYDKFVKPVEPVSDYRTHVSGVRAENLENGEDFQVVQKEISDILKGRILVGHAVYHDLKVLYLSHSKYKIRDTSKYGPFTVLFGGRTPSLKKLAERLLGVQVQDGEHNSVEDAQAAMRLYTMHKKKWEEDIKSRTLTHKRRLEHL